jgi:single-stranded-DNA-specific exonuclease
MERASSSFSEFGGHKFSGGFSIDFDKIHTLEDALVHASINILNKSPEEIFVDAELKVGDVNEARAKDINSLAPFGIGNAKPVFILYNVIPEKITRFGKGQEHLSLNIRDGSKVAKAIAFFTPLDKYGDTLIEGKPTNLVATIELSYFNPYRPETRLRIVDFF